MKKIITIMMVLVMMLMFAACGEGQDQDHPAEVPEAQETEDDSDTADQEEEDTQDSEDQREDSGLDIIYKVPMEDIYIDAPNYQEIEEAYTELFIVHRSRYAAITSAFDSTAVDAKDAHDKAFEVFVLTMQNYEGGVNSITITTEENRVVNGMDVYYFEGTINYGVDNIHDGYAVGYSFIKDGIPFQITGGVIDKEQSEELIEEIRNVVDAMIQSVRSEP